MIDLPDTDFEKIQENKFNMEEFIFTYRYPLIFVLLGALLITLGLFFLRKGTSDNFQGVEVLESGLDGLSDDSNVVVEVSGAVEKPGVYSLEKNSRIEDALISAGGISADANRDWMEKALNRAAKIVDGQKIYIPKEDEQSNTLSANNSGGVQSGSSNFSVPGEGLVNINTASQKELESLGGIGPVYGSNIIEHRPYSSLQELVSKGAIKQYVLEKIKDSISVF